MARFGFTGANVKTSLTTETGWQDKQDLGFRNVPALHSKFFAVACIATRGQDCSQGREQGRVCLHEYKFGKMNLTNT